MPYRGGVSRILRAIETATFPDRFMWISPRRVSSKDLFLLALSKSQPSIVMSPRPDLTFFRNSGTITFENKGNVTAHLQRGDYCLPDKPDICIPLRGKRVYPGASWVMNIPEELHGQKFTQTLLINGGYTTLTYPAP